MTSLIGLDRGATRDAYKGSTTSHHRNLLFGNARLNGDGPDYGFVFVGVVGLNLG